MLYILISLLKYGEGCSVWQVFSREYSHKDFCLAHLFTDLKFEGGILGLAYVGSPRRNSVGGICTPGSKFEDISFTSSNCAICLICFFCIVLLFLDVMCLIVLPNPLKVLILFFHLILFFVVFLICHVNSFIVMKLQTFSDF